MKNLPTRRLWFQFSVAFSVVVVLVGFALGTGGYFLRPNDGSLQALNLDSETQTILRQTFARTRNQGLLLFVTATGLVAIAAGVWMSKRMTAPLEELVEGAQAIGAHNLSYRVGVRGSQEVMELAEAFNKMAADLQAAEKMRQNLLADVAHELRTPLTVLQGNLRAMLDDVYSLDKSEVARLYDQTRHLNRLVSDLHLLAQAEARQLPLDIRRMDLVQLAETATASFEPVAESEGVHLQTRLPPAPLYAHVDQARLTQALQNLLANALRHTPEGGAVTVSVAQTDSQIEIEVCDSGAGIAPEHLPHLFDRFYRADRARDRDSGGAGLGLAIVRAIAEAHGGRANATSAGAGQGSTFIIMLPTQPLTGSNLI